MTDPHQRPAPSGSEPATESDDELRIGENPSPAALSRFADLTRAAGRRLVVGALIADGEGRIYLQRRTPTRSLFPGSWDLVGGHAEGHEGVLDALGREIMEETGWRLRETGPVVEVLDWEAGGVKRREVDLLVKVDGDLANPLLEPDKHSEGRWLTAAAAEQLAVERALHTGPNSPDAWVFAVVKRAFALLESR